MSETKDMHCPRCSSLLDRDVYEGEPVHCCPNCGGHWLRMEQLNMIVDRRDYKFRRGEAKRVLKTIREDGDVDRGAEWKPAHCPQCSNLMNRRRYYDACPIKLDECVLHGIWLDVGEIKELQIFIESSQR